MIIPKTKIIQMKILVKICPLNKSSKREICSIDFIKTTLINKDKKKICEITYVVKEF